MSVPVVVVDYGSANFGSVVRAFSAVGHQAKVARDINDVASARLVVLPGVGHAGTAMQHLADGWLRTALDERHAAERPILGICLGAQVMYEELEESGSHGLRWLAGRVERLPVGHDHHTGWERLDHAALRTSGLARGLTESSTFYFNHAYRLPRGSSKVEVLADASIPIVALAQHGHLLGAQFHPEKSQEAGRVLLRNLMEDNLGR
jgi:glutamine amidotransferase